ncbi:MAG: extracellular solute-binding protein [Streptosporangiales bacterium]|nr:extracellular solute-binding protein [Streptosporangiales bacterium]
MSIGSARAGSLSRRDALRLGGSLVAAGLGSSALAACARAPKQGSGGGGDQFRIYWNAGHVYDAYAEIIERFEKDHGVEVVWEKFQWEDMRPKLLADFESGNVPDLVEDPSAWATEFAVTGNVASLRSYIDSDGAEMGFPDDWQEDTVRRYTVDGQVYGIQLHLTSQQLIYNKAMFSDAGINKPPATWDDFLATARELTRGEVHGCALNYDYTYSTPWLLQNGVQYYEGSELLVPRDAAVEALQFQRDLVHKHKVSPVPPVSTDYTGPRNVFVAKKTAMIFTGPWDIAPIKEAAPDIDFGVAPALSRKTQATIAAGTGVFIPKGAKHADLAWDLIKRMTALDVELKVTEEADMTMPRKSWAEDPKIASDPVLGAFGEGLSYAEDWWDALNRTGKRGAVDELYKSMYQQVVVQNKPAADAVNTFVEQATRQVKG